GRSLRPVYVFASGTTGIGDNCAPSLETPETKRWGWYEQNMLAYAGLGFIVMFPDYTGFNDPDRPQRYFSKMAEGYMMLDAIRAALMAFPLAGTDAVPSSAVFTAGYSQGGHAAMAAADLRPQYARDLPLAGVVTYGSTNDVEALLREGVAYAPLIFYSYLSMYGSEDIQPERYLKERWMPTFEKDASTMPVDEFQAHYGFDYEPLYTQDFAKALYGGRLDEEFPELSRHLTANHTGLSGHGVPALVVQGDADFIASTATQTRFVVELREKGSAVKFLVFPKVSHRYTRMAGFNASVSWMQERAEAIGVR
ncbi:MAG: alpha/beta fold hydrolase, partial [Spirochaetales bacterium]|nr:alpha/beta fold hydrolase [Spirochaetales bacterium]